MSHFGGLVDANGDQIPSQKCPLQMSGSMTDLKDSLPLNEGNHAQDPILPPAHGNSCRDQVVREGELVIEQAKEEAQEWFHC
jgi:hypothetical protein